MQKIAVNPFEGTVPSPVELSDISDPMLGTEAYGLAQTRDESGRDIKAMPWLPQLPEQWAIDIYDRVEDYERSLIAPHLLDEEYALGTAAIQDEIVVISGLARGFLFTAEHATETIRAATNKLGDADYGTGGLAAVLGEDYGTALVMTGRQTSNPATDPEHPIKRSIADRLVRAQGFMSVHGMAGGKFVSPADPTEVHASIGLGYDPTEAMLEFAHNIANVGRNTFGLHVIVGNEQKFYVQKPGLTDVRRNDDGTAYTGRLAALRPTMTTNFVREELIGTGRRIPSLQVELTNLLRLTPEDTNKKDKVSRQIGVALGYKLLETIVELSSSNPLESA